jgi:parvulin-like peptidyl-prolyl isomerase
LRAQVQELLAGEVPTTGLVVNVQLIETETEDEAAAGMERIENGEEFAIVAQEISTDTLTAESGGDVGWVTTGQLTSRYGADLEAAAFSLEPGSLALVESNEMFYVIQISGLDENGPLPPEVLSSRQSSALSDWLDQVRASPDTAIERLLEPGQIPSDPFALTFAF